MEIYFMKIVLIIFTILIVLVTVLPLSRNGHWIIRGMDFPRLQIASIAAVLLAALIYFGEADESVYWILVAVTIVCLVYQIWWITPYTPLWRKEVSASVGGDPDGQLSLITSNVLMTNKKADRLIGLVEQYKPDILVTLETNKWWEEQLATIEEEMTHTVKCPMDNMYGMHVYSKLPLHEAKLSFLVEKDVPSIHAFVELKNGLRVRIHFLHPAPPSPSENERSGQRDAELVMVAKSIDDSNQALIVTGDLNDVAWSSTTRLFRKISGLLDPRIGRGMFNTFHADFPLLRWPLDHIFHSDHFDLAEIKRLPSIGSDHFPLYVSLCYTVKDQDDENIVEEDEEDRKRGNKIDEKMGVSKEEVPEPGE